MGWQWRDYAKFVCRARHAVPLLREGKSEAKNERVRQPSITRHGVRLLGAQAGMPVLLKGGSTRDQRSRYWMTRGSPVLCSRIW